MRGELTIGRGNELLTGRFTARPCPIPEATPRAPLGRCRPRAPPSPPLSAAELEAASQFVPLGMPMGRGGACWKAQLACRPAPGQARAAGRVEVSWMATLNYEPTIGRPFPPPTAALDRQEGIYWICHSFSGGRRNFVPTSIERARRDGVERVVFRSEDELLEVDLAAGEQGLRRAILHGRVGPPLPLVCAAPPSEGPAAERWTYPSYDGDCRF